MQKGVVDLISEELDKRVRSSRCVSRCRYYYRVWVVIQGAGYCLWSSEAVLRAHKLAMTLSRIK